MDTQELESQLHKEGFKRTYIWQDQSEVFHASHTHRTETAHIILDGEMTLTMNGESKTYFAGDRCDVPAGTVHSALIGPSGCKYLIAEK
jgi:quercetin dioxygenase-like cupin family protein